MLTLRLLVCVYLRSPLQIVAPILPSRSRWDLAPSSQSVSPSNGVSCKEKTYYKLCTETSSIGRKWLIHIRVWSRKTTDAPMPPVYVRLPTFPLKRIKINTSSLFTNCAEIYVQNTKPYSRVFVSRPKLETHRAEIEEQEEERWRILQDGRNSRKPTTGNRRQETMKHSIDSRMKHWATGTRDRAYIEGWLHYGDGQSPRPTSHLASVGRKLWFGADDQSRGPRKQCQRRIANCSWSAHHILPPKLRRLIPLRQRHHVSLKPFCPSHMYV